MFTGLIEETGRVDGIEGDERGRRLRVTSALAGDLRPGDSVAVNGVCLTVVSQDAEGFAADLSRETLAVTSFRDAAIGQIVNLERPVRADGRLGGHFVLGHVDGTGKVVAYRPDGESYWLDLELPVALLPLVVVKGSIAIDGISLTVARLSESRMGAQIVPFTHAHTSLAGARAGDLVNLEVDVLGKYVARLLATGRDLSAGLLSMER